MGTITRAQLNEMEEKLLIRLNQDCQEMLLMFENHQEYILINTDTKRQTITNVFNELRRLTESK